MVDVLSMKMKCTDVVATTEGTTASFVQVNGGTTLSRFTPVAAPVGETFTKDAVYTVEMTKVPAKGT